MDTKIAIETLDLYYSEFHALKNINMRIPEKEITAFIGPSGCGKSTLLKSLNRMNDLIEGCRITGRVLLDNDDIYANDDVNLLRKRVGMVSDREHMASKAKLSWMIWWRRLCVRRQSGMKSRTGLIKAL